MSDWKRIQHIIISMSFYLRIWRLVHTCDANANANANGNASEFTRSTQTQGKRDTQAQEVFFQDGRQWLSFCRFTRVGSERKYKLQKMKMFLYTNYCVIQRFPALRKVCLISLISCWHVIRLSRRSVRLMKERQSLHHSQSKVVCRNIFQLWLLENWNIRIDAYRQWRWNFLRKEKYQNTKWKTESYVFSGFSNGISRGYERKSTTGRFAIADYGRLPEWFLPPVRTNLFCILKIRPIVFVVIQRMFSSWVRQCTLKFVFGDCRSFYFHSFIESTFLVSKGLLYLYEKHNNTWLLVDMKFLVTCSTRHLTRSLSSLVSCWGKHSKRNSISKRTHVLSCVILYFISCIDACICICICVGVGLSKLH